MVLIQLVLICLENLQIAAAAHFFNAILFRGFDTRTATLLQTLVGKDVGQPIQKKSSSCYIFYIPKNDNAVDLIVGLNSVG